MLKVQTFLDTPQNFNLNDVITIKDELFNFSSIYSYYLTVENIDTNLTLENLYVKVTLKPIITSFYDETVKDYVLIDTNTEYFLGIIPLENLSLTLNQTSTYQLIVISFADHISNFASKNFYLNFTNFNVYPQNINIRITQIYREIIR